MNGLDLLLFVFLALAGFSGYRRGLALQAFGFGGLLLGLLVGAAVAPAVAGLAESPGAQAGAAAATLIVLAGIGDAAGWLIGRRVRERARTSRFRPVDSVGGSLVAVLASLLAIWFVALNLVGGPFPGVAREIRGSAIVRTLDDTLPQPPSLLAQARRFFTRFGFPDVFSGIPPLPADPVERPTVQEARAAVQAATDSTVQVLGEACDHLQEGSGFVAANGYVVTNAHVVAGVVDPFVRTQTGGSLQATTVLFDPDLDLAVLLVEPDPGPVLSLSPDAAERGDPGAVLGFPGGGPFDAHRAAVLRNIEAVGRNIYGSGQTERSVIELQTVVRPGNSGGPFVLSDGTVAGVVFAASTTDDGVGYAIAAREIRPRLDEAIGDRIEVGTGPCLP